VKIITYIIILGVIIFGISFAILNAEPVTLHYYLGAQQFPLSLIMILSFSLGLILGLVMMSVILLHLKADKYRLNKKIKLMEQEIQNLRALPIQGVQDIAP
jgi:lipopolysaccharide assembly protein A